MKQRKKIEFSPKILLVLFTVICVILIAVSAMFRKAAKPFSFIAGTFIIPMQNGINSVGAWVDDYFDSFESMKELQEENKALSEKVDELTQSKENLESDQSELEELRELLALDEQYKDYSKISARVIGRGATNWNQYENFIINKGSDDGIKEDMNVLAGTGLVGIVTEVGSNYAKVRSIISDESSVSAMCVSTSDTCIVNGNEEGNYNDGVIDVTYISKDAEMKAGDELVTSDISSKYLPGLRIGTVSDITMDNTNLTKSGHVTPVVDFQHIREVLVLLELKEVPDDIKSED